METAVPPAPHDDLGAYLAYMVALQASDLFLTAGAVPTLKIQGLMRPLPMPMAALAPNRIKELAYSMMSEAQMRRFEADLECDLAVGIESLGRFRLNVYVQRGQVSMVAVSTSTLCTMPIALRRSGFPGSPCRASTSIRHRPSPRRQSAAHARAIWANLPRCCNRRAAGP